MLVAKLYSGGGENIEVLKQVNGSQAVEEFFSSCIVETSCNIAMYVEKTTDCYLIVDDSEDLHLGTRLLVRTNMDGVDLVLID